VLIVFVPKGNSQAQFGLLARGTASTVGWYRMGFAQRSVKKREW
jgi:hypothetical protein